MAGSCGYTFRAQYSSSRIATGERRYPATAGRVWIVENSGVYSILLDAVPDAPLICTRGQFKLAALKLMDMLVDAGVPLYYAGDIDPEGVAMADRLLARYPRHAQLWRMDIASYHKSLSDNHMEEERMAKLLNVTNEALLPVIRDMQEKRKAGYQEGLFVAVGGGFAPRVGGK